MTELVHYAPRPVAGRDEAFSPVPCDPPNDPADPVVVIDTDPAGVTCPVCLGSEVYKLDTSTPLPSWLTTKRRLF